MNKILHFEAPGRVEISGNHTDHQHGIVLAAAVNLKAAADVVLNASKVMRIESEGYSPVEVDVNDLAVRESEKNTTAALIRGVAAAFKERGCVLGGFDAKVKSTVLPGSGLSSSAAFEVLMGRILNSLFFANRLDAIEIAQIGQFAENTYFGKPCGLMDQTASSVGGLMSIDFRDPARPDVEKIDFDFSTCGYTLCVVDSGADHADLTDEYASIPLELKTVCGVFEKEYLRNVNEDLFLDRLPEVREAAGDRATLRAMHIFAENHRVERQINALKGGNFETFLKYVNASGESSWMYLQNVIPTGSTRRQEMALTISLCRQLLQGRGAVRVHGGGFAGTVLAFVPDDLLPDFKAKLDRMLGNGRCHVLFIQ